MSKEPLALGIHVKHDASVALCSPQGVIFALAEERVSRVKHHCGFPRSALEELFRSTGITAKDIAAVAFSTRRVLYPGHRNSWVADVGGIAKKQRASTAAGNIIRRWIYGRSVDDPTKGWEEFADRHWLRYEDYLRELGLMDGRILHYYVAHHRAHASSAFRLSGMDEACVLTLDGLGDGLSGTIYKGHPDGRMELLRKSAAKDSLGSFYQAATEALGFVPVDSEYKTMGLAAFGLPDGKENPFRDIMRVEDGVLKSSTAWRMRSYNAAHPEKKVPNPLGSIAQADEYAALLSGMKREEFASAVQAHCEERMLDYARDGLGLAGSRNLACAGGVMLNVKGNARIRDEIRPEGYFVFPDAGDSGLSAGAAMEALYQMGVLRGQAEFENTYLGHNFGDAEIEKEVSRFCLDNGFAAERSGPAPIADKLIQGKVVGTFQGRLETGPRALGNRSVLADPRAPEVKDRINSILKGREWFVPFAPAVLDEDAALYWNDSREYRYMTFAVKAAEYAVKNIPAVVHVDGTLRPQMVSERSNLWLYRVLREFKKRTGVGVLLNTSFNRHGLPIVGSPRDALEHLQNGWVDGLSIGEFYVQKS